MGAVEGDDKSSRSDAGEPDVDASHSVILAEALARVLGVPQSVFAFLEAKIPEVRAIVDRRGRVYRARDAILLAGLADMLYREGRQFRDVADMLATPDRSKILAHGRARLSGALAARDVMPSPPPSGRAVPPDAVVVARGRARHERRADAREVGHAEGTAGVAANGLARSTGRADLVAELLTELMVCVRTLEAVR